MDTKKTKRGRKTSIAFFTLFLLFALGCESLDLPEDIPRCIEKKIKKFKRREVCDQGATVTQYDFQGQTVYVFSPGNTCGYDISASVVDQNCDVVCALGGFTGNIICNGDTLYLEVTNEKLLWSN